MFKMWFSHQSEYKHLYDDLYDFEKHFLERVKNI